MATASSPARLLQRAVSLLLVPVVSGLVLLAGSGTAHAAPGYKYWNYYHVKGGTYAFAQTGPSDFVPKDGAVEAYRYGLSTAADGLPPRTGATTYTIDDLCAGQQAKSGQKRVGVLLDYGTAGDAASGDTPPKPRGACAVVPEDANGQQVLGAVAKVRVEKSLTCGIDGYPTRGCSVTVKNPPAPAKQRDVTFAMPKQPEQPEKSGSSSDSSNASQQSSDQGGVPWTLVGVVVVVLVLAAGGLLLARRNRAG